MCVYGVPPAPVYKGQGQGGRPARREAQGGVPLLPGVGLLPPNPIPNRTLREKEKRGGPAPSPSPNRTREGGFGRLACGLPLLSFPLRPNRPICLPGGSGNPPGNPVKSRFHPEHFRCPNIGFQYINLYVSTISRLLVISVITSGTPNNLVQSRYRQVSLLVL